MHISRVIKVNYALVGYCAACSGNSLPTFRDNLSFPSSRERWDWLVVFLENGTAAQ